MRSAEGLIHLKWVGEIGSTGGHFVVNKSLYLNPFGNPDKNVLAIKPKAPPASERGSASSYADWVGPEAMPAIKVERKGNYGPKAEFEGVPDSVRCGEGGYLLSDVSIHPENEDGDRFAVRALPEIRIGSELCRRCDASSLSSFVVHAVRVHRSA